MPLESSIGIDTGLRKITDWNSDRSCKNSCNAITVLPVTLSGVSEYNTIPLDLNISH